MTAREPAFKMNSYENLRASTIDFIDLYSWNKALPFVPIISVNASALSDTIKEVCRRDSLEFERRFMKNNTEETFQHLDIIDKETYARGRKLIDLLLDHRNKGSRAILSFQRHNHARVLLKTEDLRVFESIKISERVQLKVNMKDLVTKKRDSTQTELYAETVHKHISETPNDVRTCVDTGVFDFGEEISSNRDKRRERDIGDHEWKKLV